MRLFSQHLDHSTWANPQLFQVVREGSFFLFFALCALLSSCAPYVNSAANNPVSLTASSIGSAGGTTVTFTAPLGSLYSTVTVDEGADFLSTNVCQGRSIFGLAGGAACSDGILASTIYRNAGSAPQLTQSQVVTTYAGSGSSATLPSSYREVPEISQDDDGFCNTDAINAGYCTVAGNAYYTTKVASISWSVHVGIPSGGLSNCGEPTSMASSTTLSAAKIADRITHCAQVNGSLATWSGVTYGNSSEGVWKIVTRNTPQGTCTATVNSCRPVEVWQDQRTGLLWSSLVAGSVASSGAGHAFDNWCRAAGNDESTTVVSGTPWPYTDPFGYCNNATYQNQTNPKSYCAETAIYGPALTRALATENWSTGVYDLSKGGMGATASSTSPGVKWHLPTIHDYELAEVDGIRYVMPDMGAMAPFFPNAFEWTASMVSSVRAYASTFSSDTGIVSTKMRNLSLPVRCVGR